MHHGPFQVATTWIIFTLSDRQNFTNALLYAGSGGDGHQDSKGAWRATDARMCLGLETTGERYRRQQVPEEWLPTKWTDSCNSKGHQRVPVRSSEEWEAGDRKVWCTRMLVKDKMRLMNLKRDEKSRCRRVNPFQQGSTIHYCCHPNRQMQKIYWNWNLYGLEQQVSIALKKVFVPIQWSTDVNGLHRWPRSLRTKF